jgi:hypothetical protein
MSIHVILNYANRVSGNSQSATYVIDWNAVLKPNKSYSCHFTYIGGANVITGTKLALVYADFNGQEVYQNSSTSSGANRSQILGFLKPIVLVGSTGTCYLQAETNTNEAIRLNNRPLNNFITISIYDQNGALFTDNAGVPANPADYVLSLHFSELKE